MISDGMVTYPGLPGPVITDHLSRMDSRAQYAAGTEFHIGRIDMVANTGTYLDVPSHRFEEGFDLSGLPLDSVADLPGVCVASSSRSIGVSAFDGLSLRGVAVLISTGWDRHWGSETYGDASHPHLTRDAATFLVEMGVRLVGIDSVNIDATDGGERPVHSTLLEAGVLVVEHLTGLDRLVGRSFRFFAVPPKVEGMGTFPVRAFALIDDG